MRAALILSLLLLVGCAPISGDTTTTVPSSMSTTVTTTPVDPSFGCPQNVDFVDTGRVMRLDQPSSDSSIIGVISWQVAEGCESFEIAFETAEGAPATIPPSVLIEFLETRQVLRIHLGADRTVITDQLVETGFVDRAYVVKGLDGRMFIDLHLSQPVQARADVQRSPARLTLDLQAGLEPFDGGAAISERAVVVKPSDGSEAGTSFAVSGYARTFEGNVLVIVTSGDEVVAETTAIAADWADTWGEFETRIEVPAGENALFVGEADPEDGSLAGVSVRVINR